MAQAPEEQMHPVQTPEVQPLLVVVGEVNEAGVVVVGDVEMMLLLFLQLVSLYLGEDALLVVTLLTSQMLALTVVCNGFYLQL